MKKIICNLVLAILMSISGITSLFGCQECTALKAKTKELEADINRYKTDCKTNAETIALYQKNIEQLKSQEENGQQTKEYLMKQLEIINSQKKNETEKYETQIKELQVNLQNQNGVLQGLQNKLDLHIGFQTTLEEDKKKLIGELETLKQQHTQLQSNLTEKSNAEIEELRKNLDAATTLVKQTNSELIASNLSKEDLGREISKLKAQLTTNALENRKEIKRSTTLLDKPNNMPDTEKTPLVARIDTLTKWRNFFFGTSALLAACLAYMNRSYFSFA